jgi:hypothetical protein
MRYNIRSADDNRAYLDKFCARLISAGGLAWYCAMICPEVVGEAGDRRGRQTDDLYVTKGTTYKQASDCTHLPKFWG